MSPIQNPTSSSVEPASPSPRRTDADVPAIARLINAAFVVERPIFDHDRIDDIGVRDYMTKGKFLLHERAVDAAKNLVACVYLEPNSNDARCYLGLLSIAPDQQGTGLGHRILTQSEKFAPHRRLPHNLAPHAQRPRPTSAPLTTSASATNSWNKSRCPPVFHPKIPCEFVVMEKRLT